jgi:Flp pilus assembly protein TadD
MRPIILLPLILLAACAVDPDKRFATGTPGLDVANVALANGAPETALHIAESKLAANPRDVPALVMAGGAQTALGQREKAAQSFSRALTIAPNDPNALLGLGRLQLASDPAAAATVFQQLITRDPRNVAALINLGIARDLLGQHAEAQRTYREALALDPGRIAGKINLGLSLALSGDPQGALAILRPVALNPGATPRMRQDLAVALVLAGDDEEAARVLHADMPKPQADAALSGYRSLRAGS